MNLKNAIISLFGALAVLFILLVFCAYIAFGHGFTAPTTEDFYNSTINRSVRIGRDATGQMYPISRNVRPHDQTERRRGSAVLSVIIFEKGKKHGYRQYRRLAEP